MSAKKTITEESRSLELELEVPGSPEQVWRALATGPGITSWFAPTRMEEREGGAIQFELGPGMESGGTVTAWEPPRRFAYEEVGWSGEAPPLATGVRIEARAGGICLVRLVHSLFTGSDEWDDQIGSFEAGWNSFFDVLRLYLLHFEGRPCSATRVMGRSEEGEAEAWEALRGALGLGAANPGERVETAAGAPRLAGIVERLGTHFTPSEILLRLDQPAPGLALIGAYSWGGAIHTAMSLFFYGEGAAEALEREGPLWTAWMAEHFPAPPPAEEAAHP